MLKMFKAIQCLHRYLRYDKSKFDKNVKLEDTFNTPEDSDFGYVVEVHLKYPDYIQEKNEELPICS